MESLFLTLGIGSHMDSSGIWGIARVTVKVIAGVIVQFMPVVSAIIPKLYKNSCDYILIIYLKSLEQCCAEQMGRSLLNQENMNRSQYFHVI